MYFIYRKNCVDPVTILGIYSRAFLRGRQLDITDLTCPIPEGETTSIILSRETLLHDVMEEARLITDFTLPLEVTFMGEEAEDLGGPRREMFELAMRDIKEKFFEMGEQGWVLQREDVAAVFRDQYYAAGLIMGTFTETGQSAACISLQFTYL